MDGMTARWQESIRSALIARDVRERAFEPFIRDYSRLAHHANQLRQRNLALVDAASGASRATTAANQDQNRASLGGGGQDELGRVSLASGRRSGPTLSHVLTAMRAPPLQPSGPDRCPHRSNHPPRVRTGPRALRTLGRVQTPIAALAALAHPQRAIAPVG